MLADETAQPAPAEPRRSFGPEQAEGPPDVKQAGDNSQAWASQTTDGQREWLALDFKDAQLPAEIIVHENHAPGAIDKVTVFDAAGKEVVAWEGVDPTPRDQPWSISVFPVNVDFKFQRVKLYINSPEVPSYNEVNAVGLRDKEGKVQWAIKAVASSTYGDSRPFESPAVGMTRGPGMSAGSSFCQHARADSPAELSSADDLVITGLERPPRIRFVVTCDGQPWRRQSRRSSDEWKKIDSMLSRDLDGNRVLTAEELRGGPASASPPEFVARGGNGRASQ